MELKDICRISEDSLIRNFSKKYINTQTGKLYYKCCLLPSNECAVVVGTTNERGEEGGADNIKLHLLRHIRNLVAAPQGGQYRFTPILRPTESSARQTDSRNAENETKENNNTDVERLGLPINVANCDHSCNNVVECLESGDARITVQSKSPGGQSTFLLKVREKRLYSSTAGPNETVIPNVLLKFSNEHFLELNVINADEPWTISATNCEQSQSGVIEAVNCLDPPHPHLSPSENHRPNCSSIATSDHNYYEDPSSANNHLLSDILLAASAYNAFLARKLSYDTINVLRESEATFLTTKSSPMDLEEYHSLLEVVGPVIENELWFAPDIIRCKLLSHEEELILTSSTNSSQATPGKSISLSYQQRFLRHDDDGAFKAPPPIRHSMPLYLSNLRRLHKQKAARVNPKKGRSTVVNNGSLRQIAPKPPSSLVNNPQTSSFFNGNHEEEDDETSPEISHETIDEDRKRVGLIDFERTNKNSHSDNSEQPSSEIALQALAELKTKFRTTRSHHQIELNQLPQPLASKSFEQSNNQSSSQTADGSSSPYSSDHPATNKDSGAVNDKNNNNKQNVCKICKASLENLYFLFTSSSSLRVHYRSHAGVRPFQCSQCAASFTRKHSLNYHLLLHTGEVKYTCPFCAKTFRHAGHFKDHLRVHNCEPFICRLCRFPFSNRTTLRRHLRLSHGQEAMPMEVDGKQDLESNKASTTSNSTNNLRDSELNSGNSLLTHVSVDNGMASPNVPGKGCSRRQSLPNSSISDNPTRKFTNCELAPTPSSCSSSNSLPENRNAETQNMSSNFCIFDPMKGDRLHPPIKKRIIKRI